MNTWPDGAMTPFRSEKNTNWEGAYRVPAMFRWPGKIKPGKCPTILSDTSICCKAANILICNGALSLAVSTCNMDWSTCG